ncbi:MAG: homoserine kinase [Propionibacteriales bacterium]|nr:homoserine kinase [Propionibacteriales bacterium]
MRRQVRVRVPATSANLGPGFDSFGLSLGWYDEVTVTVVDAGLEVKVTGEGADAVPRDESHLVVSSLRAGLRLWGGEPPGLRLACRNRIPHSRGLGSSASAIVAGLMAARVLGTESPAAVDDTDVLQAAAELEGHPDNVAACIYGGFTVAWQDGDRARATSLRPHPDVVVVACVPAQPMSTEAARGLLPATVPHADAAFSASRAGLLVAALTQHPDLLLAATEDRLHQPYRSAAMAPSAKLIDALRARGVAAVVSGAGPTVLALTSASGAAEVGTIAGSDWRVEPCEIDPEGASVESVE